MQQGFVTRFTHSVYASGFIVTREMNDDNQYNIIKQMSSSLAYSGIASRETVLGNVLNRAITAGYTGGDGIVLLSASHVNKSGGTWSNLETGDLTETSLEQACTDLAGFKNDRGVFINAMPRKLIVNPAEGFNAARILTSTLQNDTAQNAINVLRTQNKIPEGVTQWSYMTDTDAWFVQTDVKYGLVYVQRDSDEFGGMPTNDWDTENQKFKNRMRFSAGWVDPRGIIGSVGG